MAGDAVVVLVVVVEVPVAGTTAVVVVLVAGSVMVVLVPVVVVVEFSAFCAKATVVLSAARAAVRKARFVFMFCRIGCRAHPGLPGHSSPHGTAAVPRGVDFTWR